MSFLLFYFLYILSFIINIESKPVTCDDSNDDGVCNADINGNKTETLGQEILRKQTELYGLDKPYYNQYSSAIGIRVHNPNDETYDAYWYDPSRMKGIWKGKLHSKRHTATNSYVGHKFYYTKVGEPNKKVYEFTVQDSVNDYIVPPKSKKEAESEFYKKVKEKQLFYKEYYQKTGRGWLSGYKRPKPILHMWKADYVGQIHTIKTKETYWKCDIKNEETSVDIAYDKAKKLFFGSSDKEYNNKCRDTGELTINIEVISKEPKVFVIEGMLSDFEAESIISLATPKLHRSGVGQAADANYADETRTSKTAWLGYTEHYIVDTLYKRAADILQIEEATLKRNAEYMQTVYYEIGQEYKAHHDFADAGRDESRYITLLFYLNNQKTQHAGGETMFPKANDGKGLKTHPGKGNAVLFYDLLEDGNGDDLTLHEAVKVVDGHKWLANFWVWDPKK